MAVTVSFLDLSSKRSFMSSGLTFELWRYISQFLSNDQLCKLYSVNRAFFYIAMPLRYNKLSLPGRGGLAQNVDAGKYVRVIEAPSLGKHVHTLTFNLTEYGPTERIGRLLYKEELLRIKAFAPLAEYLYALCHPIQQRKTRKFKAEVCKTKAFIASLDQLTSLVVQWYQDCPVYLNYNVYTDIFLLGWSTFGSRLRSLSLHMTTDSFPYLFDTELYLPHLEALALDLYKCRDKAGSPKSIRSSPTTPFIKFIRRHFKTLASLRIISLSSLDREKFYAGIGKLPSLCAFNLEEIHQYQELYPPTSFLLLHSATLTEFSWSLKRFPNWTTTTSPSTIRAETPLDIGFPELRKLALNFPIFQDQTTDTQKIINFINHHAKLLTSLTLNGERFYEQKIHVQMPQLRALEISTYHWITTSTFPALATHLPNLETLTIRYGNFGMDVLDFPVMDSSTALTDYLAKTTISDLFVERIRVPSVSNWRLHSLALERKSYQWDCSLEYVVLEVITENMPHLQFINGMEREDFLRLTRCRSLVQERLRGPTFGSQASGGMFQPTSAYPTP